MKSKKGTVTYIKIINATNKSRRPADVDNDSSRRQSNIEKYDSEPVSVMNLPAVSQHRSSVAEIGSYLLHRQCLMGNQYILKFNST